MGAQRRARRLPCDVGPAGPWSGLRAAAMAAAMAAGCTTAGAQQGGGTSSDATSAAADTISTNARATEKTSTSEGTGSTDTTSGSAGDAQATTGVAWAQRLSPIVFRDVNTLTDVLMRLYKDDGSIDESAAIEVERVLWIGKDEPPPKVGKGAAPVGANKGAKADDEAPLHVNRRLLQLVVKVTEHFGVHEVQVISSHRGKARKGSRHRSGEAIDFVLPGVPPKTLAEVLRTYPRVGVGVYIHPKAQFVHLDVREQSYHWIDGSPPGRVWREQAMPDATAKDRDAAYSPRQDLPDGA